MKKEKSLARRFVIGLKIAIILCAIVLTILHFVNSDSYPKIWSYLATIGLVFAPEFLKIFKIEITNRLQITYLLFLIPAMVIGIDLDGYKTIILFGQPCFDKVCHTLSGVLAAFVAKEALDNCYTGTENKNKKYYDSRFAYLFIVSFVALSAAGWECFEFLYDKFTGGSMQELIASGVDDTMWDILSALIAALITALPLCRKK